MPSGRSIQIFPLAHWWDFFSFAVEVLLPRVTRSRATHSLPRQVRHQRFTQLEVAPGLDRASPHMTCPLFPWWSLSVDPTSTVL